MKIPKVLESIRKENIVKIRSGGDSSFAITDKGVVYAWGGGWNGQLGTGTKENIFEPVKMKFDGKIKDIIPGASHTLVIAEDDTVWSCGWALGGRLGQGGLDYEQTMTSVDGQKEFCLEPKRIEFFDNNKIKLATAGGHNLVLAEDGKMYALRWCCHTLVVLSLIHI
eukprot:TRINITY_DN3239_c1_g2_i1.p1 TRINITY_DN3239_c1_g2~~TRINITY_DN3239_c1_g2_i1.p1  ORF type:complete len:167 (+),score=33.53 TRINITY_DN3239_c1_g2_i1:542-1042(+)